MNEYSCTEERFLADVAEHQMTVVQDDGGRRRHVRFERENTINQYFDLITWPGHLCFTGDMGTYVFARTPDMFEFFRDKPARNGRQLGINPGYWSEKLLAVDRRDGLREFSPQRFREAVITEFRMAWEGTENYSARRECWDELRATLLEQYFEDERDGMTEAMNFRMSFSHGDFTLQDFWDNDLTEYTFRFIWCCYAIAWGIQQYDAAKENAA